jgi:hypothetical protein
MRRTKRTKRSLMPPQLVGRKEEEVEEEEATSQLLRLAEGNPT